MFSIFIQNIILLASIVLAFYLGRRYSIIRRDKLADNDITDIFQDVHTAIADRETPPTARIISPSQKKATELKELEDTTL